MKIQMNVVKPVWSTSAAGLFAVGSAMFLAPAILVAAEPVLSTSTVADVPAGTRYGLFDWLDHRSAYGEGVFPEPFLVDDSDLEDNELRLDWLHTRAGGQQSDEARAEIEKGFGLLTLELEVPYARNVDAGNVSQGVGNISLGARYPFYQFVAAGEGFDTTFGAAVEVGIPVNSAISKNTELVPKIFNDLRVGGHFTLQSIFGWSTLFGGGDDGGLQTFESGFVFGYTVQHQELPLPGVLQFIPMFELVGETGMNNGESGQTSFLGNVCFRANLNTIGEVQPRLGLGFVFPVDSNARAGVHWGIVTSLVFEY